jgi:outer membrane protein assembly factor BamD (BamD/ComL family)
MLLFTLLLASGVVLALGFYLALNRSEFVVLAIGMLALIVTAGFFGLAGRGGGGATGDEAARQSRLLQAIADRMLISDQAKRIAYREKDRDALRQAILEDIRKEDYGTALALVNDMASLYGYREEAEKYRQQIIEAQARRRQAQVTAAVAHVDQLLQRREWDTARHEVERLTRIYGEDPQIVRLPDRVREAMDRYKIDVTREFREAYERQDIDRASTLLTEMDRYLSQDEARPFVDMARNIFTQKRENLGVQYKLAVQDRDFGRALAIAEQVIREFPNTQFAAELREMLDTLRSRAATQRATV